MNTKSGQQPSAAGVTVAIEGPTNILLIEGLDDGHGHRPVPPRHHRRRAHGSTINVVGSLKDAAPHAAEVEVILGVVYGWFLAMTPQSAMVHATASESTCSCSTSSWTPTWC